VEARHRVPRRRRDCGPQDRGRLRRRSDRAGAVMDHPALKDGSFAHLKLGRNKRDPDPRTLVLAKYLNLEKLPVAPASADYATKLHTWPMYGNDTLGECTCAAAGHMIQAWTANDSTIHTPTTASVEKMYWATGSQDDGRNELDILNYWRHTGLASDRIYA